MSDSTGIVLAATAISFGNKWVSTGNVDLAIPLAGGFIALMFNGIERLDHTAGVGLAWLMMISVLVTTPKGGTSPGVTLAGIAGVSSGTAATNSLVKNVNTNKSRNALTNSVPQLFGN